MASVLKETVRELFSPAEYLQDIFSVNLDSLKNRGIKLLLIDVNNTVLPQDALQPSLRTIHWFEQLREYSFQTVLVSSSLDKNRLTKIASVLKVPVYYFVLKPMLPAVRHILAERKIAPEECALIGDALWTDVLPAKLLGIYSVLVEKCDQPIMVDREIGFLRHAKAAILDNVIHQKIS